MAPRTLLHLLTAIAAATLFTEAASAGVYQAPDRANPLESRIQALRQGDWQPLLDGPDRPGQAGDTRISWWANGGGRGWGNGGWRRDWGNGGGWGNGGWGNGGWGNAIGWPNGAGWGNGATGGFINW